MATTATTSELIDWNGDGRLDVVDALPDAPRWRVWLNLPDDHAALRWQPVTVETEAFAQVLADSGLDVDVPQKMRPLDEAKSWPESIAFRCDTLDGAACPESTTFVIADRSDTVTQWTLEDFNGDSFPDLIANTAPSIECEAGSSAATVCHTETIDGVEHNACGQVLGRQWLVASGAYTGSDDQCTSSARPPRLQIIYNRGGVLARTPTAATPSVTTIDTSDGLSTWTTGSRVGMSDEPAPQTTFDPSVSWHQFGFLDEHALGTPRRAEVQDPTAQHLGLEQFDSDHDEACRVNHLATYRSVQTSGLADLDGDGLPDLVQRVGSGETATWQVRFGTTAGFGDAHGIETSSIDAQWPRGFAISDTDGNCTGDSTTVAGLVDLDGDGRADFVWQGDDDVLRHAHVEVQRGLVGGELVAIGNGFGATTHILYRNNKLDTHSAHQVPAPEIVVSGTVTTGTDPDGVPTKYAYGTPEMRYDPTFDRVTFAGYRRTVSVTGSGTVGVAPRGTATIIDHVRQAEPGAGFLAYALGGRVLRTPRRLGAFDANPSVLLDIDTTDTPTLDSRARAQKEETAQLTELAVAPLDSFVGIDECVDIDVNLQSPFIGSDGPLCRHAGVVTDQFTRSWEGTHEAADRRVEQFTAVEEVDEHGRAIQVRAYGDSAVAFDDTCTTIDYATPTSTALPTLSVIASMTTDDCGGRAAGSGNGPLLLGGTRFAYDGEPEGVVSRGQIFSEILENYNTTDGSLLDEQLEVTLGYDGLGNVDEASESRGGDSPATCTTTYERDDFGATTTSVTTVATGLAQPFVRHFSRSTWPHLAETDTGLNGEKTTTTRDAFGRIKEVHLVDGTADHLQVKYDYKDSAPREITETRYPAVLPLVTRERFDSLGRPRFRQADLGIDYNAHSLITDYVEYDELGRVRFAAAPFEWAGGAFDPSLVSPSAWGVTSVYDDAGRLVRQVEAAGKHPEVDTTSVPNHFVSSYSYAWLGHRAITRASGPRDNDPTAVAFGAFDETQVTAMGWSMEDSRTDGNGARLDLVRRGYDRLGHETVLRRYRNPSAASDLVEWTTIFDTAGRVLASQEPGSSIVSNDYDDWGNLVQTSWLDGASDLRVQRRTYDGIGRQTQIDLLTRDLDTDTDSIESSEHDFYDVASGSSTQPSSPLLGRLSYAETTGVGDAYFAYDRFGRLTTEAYSLIGAPTVHSDRAYTPGGLLSELDFTTPAGTDRIGYTIDSAARTTAVTDLIAHRALFDASGHNIDAKGRYRKVYLGNGVRETNDFDTTGREDLVHQGFQTGSGVRNHNLNARDADGRLLDEIWTGNGTVHLVNEFDRMGRLGRQGQPGNDERFLYDGLGNVVTKRNVNAIAQNRDFAYDPNDLDQLCTSLYPGGTSNACHYSYDGAGNVSSDSSTGTMRLFSYDAGSRITAIQRGAVTANFLYGPGGALAREDIFNGTTLTRQTWSFGDLIEQTSRLGHTEIDRRIPGPEGLVATLRYDVASAARETIYVHGDARGNRFFTKSDGKVTQEVRYRAYGDVISDSGATAALTYTDDLWNGGDDMRDLGVDLLGARVYDPALGRFLQRDPLAFTATSSGASPYAFALGDPVNFSDPSGLCAKEDYSCQNAAAGISLLVAGATAFIQEGHDPAPHAATAVSIAPVTLPLSTESVGISDVVGGYLRGEARAHNNFLRGLWHQATCSGPLCNLESAQGLLAQSKLQLGLMFHPIDTLESQGNGDPYEGAGFILNQAADQAALAVALDRFAPVGGVRPPAEPSLAPVPDIVASSPLPDADVISGNAQSFDDGQAPPPPDVPPSSGGGLPPDEAPTGWTKVSRWMSPQEAEVWRGRSSMPQPLADRTQVTSFGAPRPGAASDVVRVDFEVPSHALQPGGTRSWFNIFNQSRAVPIRDVTVVPQP